MEHQTLANQTLYAQLLDLLTTLEAQRSIGHVAGTFVDKSIKGRTYLYFQYSVPGGVTRQVFVGRKDEVLERVVAHYLTSREAFQGDLAQAQQLCGQLRAGHAMTTDSATGRVLAHLAESGFFRLGGVLVGTHSFAVLGNVLGVRWDWHFATEDIDIATELRIAIPEIDVDLPGTLDRLQMGFLPVPALDPKQTATSFKVRGRSLRVDLLTPSTGRRGSNHPVFIPALNAAAQPLRYLDYLLENTQRAVLIDGGGVLVNVPDPARFALHKLVVADERIPAFQVKKIKDIGQAAQCLDVLCRDRPGDVTIAFEELRRRNWTRRVLKGLQALKAGHPETFHAIQQLLRFK